MHVRDATSEVDLLVGDEELLDDDLLSVLAEAAADDVAIWVEVPTEASKSRLPGKCQNARASRPASSTRGPFRHWNRIPAGCSWSTARRYC